MHSEPTASQHLRQTDRPPGVRALRRIASSVALVGLIMLTLVGCAEGTSRDAERGREEDAERTSVVDLLQASASADLVRRAGEATPPPNDAAATEPASDSGGNRTSRFTTRRHTTAPGIRPGPWCVRSNVTESSTGRSTHRGEPARGSWFGRHRRPGRWPGPSRPARRPQQTEHPVHRRRRRWRRQ